MACSSAGTVFLFCKSRRHAYHPECKMSCACNNRHILTGEDRTAALETRRDPLRPIPLGKVKMRRKKPEPAPTPATEPASSERKVCRYGKNCKKGTKCQFFHSEPPTSIPEVVEPSSAVREKKNCSKETESCFSCDLAGADRLRLRLQRQDRLGLFRVPGPRELDES